jgi:hypothetical protein
MPIKIRLVRGEDGIQVVNKVVNGSWKQVQGNTTIVKLREDVEATVVRREAKVETTLRAREPKRLVHVFDGRPPVDAKSIGRKLVVENFEAIFDKAASSRPSPGIQPLQHQATEIRSQIAKLEEQLRSLNVAEVPKVILPELHDAATGRVDAQKVAEFMGVPLKQLSEGLGLNYKAVHRSPTSASFQKSLMPVKRSLEYLQLAFQKPGVIRAWLNTAHPMLEGQTALETILEGKAFAIERLLGNAWRGVVS